MPKPKKSIPLYDVFICHSSEDKKDVVRELAKNLRRKHIEVWYDEFTLNIGDSIRRAIDKGLRHSRYGIVVLSKSFFAKEWPQYELDGLVEKEIAGREKVILPIWHKVSHEEVARHSPSLAGRLAANTSIGLKGVADQLSSVIKPKSSPLVVARDYLITWDVKPPVVTDKHWLRVVEASNKLLPFGAAIPEQSVWDRWSFPLPPKSDKPDKWGIRLAWAYMQLNWVQKANSIPITPLTHYQQVHKFIHNCPGLFETCQAFPSLLIEWAPQLTIPGFEGEFLDIIESSFQKSFKECSDQKERNSPWGTGLTIDKKTPLCDGDFALRAPNFANYEPEHIAYSYFHGSEFGPTVSPFEDADHLFWLLSSDSEWLPKAIREYLLEGLAKSFTWVWGRLKPDKGGERDTCGVLQQNMFSAIANEKTTVSEEADDDLIQRISHSKKLLGFSNSVDEIKRRFISQRVIDKTIEAEKRLIRERNERDSKR
jgi:hypothetical protein